MNRNFKAPNPAMSPPGSAGVSSANWLCDPRRRNAGASRFGETERLKSWVAKRGGFHLEIAFFAFVLIFLNWPMLHGACNLAMIFLPGAVGAGEWWRVLTHPFVHVTWYHLLLDASAFFLLYHELKAQPFLRRVTFLVASGVGSLLIPLFTDLSLAEKGLCGLSGIAHGLMAVCALDSMSRPEDKLVARIGLIYFAVVIGKTLVEALTGNMLFGWLYFGMIGDPVTTTHAGGVLGGLIAWLVVRRKDTVPRGHLLGAVSTNRSRLDQTSSSGFVASPNFGSRTSILSIIER